MNANKLLSLILAGAMTCAVAHAEKKDYKHEGCYNYQRGIEAVQNDNDDEAIKYLSEEIKEHPSCDRAYQQLAVIYGNQGENGDALTYINLALKYCPKKDKENLAFNHYVKAKVLQNLNKTAEAEAEFTMAINTEPDNSSHYEYRGEFYYGEQQYDKALADYKKASELEPGVARYFVGIGACLEATEKYQEALDQYEYALKLSPGNATNIAYKGDALLKLKKYNDAINCYIEAVNTDNETQAAYHGLNSACKEVPNILIAKLKAQHIKKPKEVLWTALLAATLNQTRNYTEAIKYYHELIEEEPSAKGFAVLAETYKNAGNLPCAIKYIDKAIEMEEANPASSDSTDMAQSIATADAAYTLQKANYLDISGDYDKAIEVENACIEQNPENTAAYATRAITYLRKKEGEKALADINTAIDMDEPTTYLLYTRGRINMLLGKKDEAIADFKTVASDTTETETAPYALFYLGEKQKAIETTDSLLKADDNKANINYNAACLYSLMNEKDTALKYLEQAFKINVAYTVYTKTDPDFDNIRETPEFKALIATYEEQLKKQIEGMNNLDSASEEQYEEATCQVPYTKKGGVTQVKCQVNGLPLHFIFDTGAATISISSVEAMFMLKNDYLSTKDIVGSSLFTDANGDISEGTVINLKEVKIGDATLKDVKASVVHNQKAPLLLGQSAFQKFGKIEIDNAKKMVTITYKKKK